MALSRRETLQFMAMASLLGCDSQGPRSDGRAKLKLAASIYVGWMPWMLAAEQGLLSKNAQQKGLSIDLVRGDYAETIDLYLNGHVEAVVMTNIDAMATVIDRGIESDIVLIGSFSAGNDAVLARDGMSELPDKAQVALVQNSVSDYLLGRYLESQQRTLESVKLVNVSDADIASTFASASGELPGVATWNPIVSSLETNLNAKRLFDSKQIPREIADVLLVRRKALQDFPQFAPALLGTWFETMRLLSTQREQTVADLARLSESSADDYLQQLQSTDLIDTQEKALAAMQAKELLAATPRITEFVASRGLAKGDREQWFGVDEKSQATLRLNPQPLRS